MAPAMSAANAGPTVRHERREESRRTAVTSTRATSAMNPRATRWSRPNSTNGRLVSGPCRAGNESRREGEPDRSAPLRSSVEDVRRVAEVQAEGAGEGLVRRVTAHVEAAPRVEPVRAEERDAQAGE